MLKVSNSKGRMLNSVLSEDRTRIHYLCSLLEYTARKTNNSRCDIIKRMSEDDITHEFSVALTNACLSFEQVSDELIEYLNLEIGNVTYDVDVDYVYDYLTVGTLLQTCIIAWVEKGNIDITTAIREVVSSKISDTLAFVS